MPSKLKTIRPLVGTIKPLVGRMEKGEKAKPFHEWQQGRPSLKWLKSAWWQAARKRVLLRDLYRCQWPGCGAIVAGKGQAHIDHIDPHREDKAKFFCSDAGLQTLCVTCHVSKKQIEDRREMLR